MTSTDRNKQRMARLLARHVEVEVETQLLVELHRDLGAAGELYWASRVAGILRTGALKAVAEYTRRNASLFAIHGPQSPGVDEGAERERQIVALADKIDALADGVGGKSGKYGQFEEILSDLHKKGSFPTNDFVSAVAQGYFLSE